MRIDLSEEAIFLDAVLPLVLPGVKSGIAHFGGIQGEMGDYFVAGAALGTESER